MTENSSSPLYEKVKTDIRSKIINHVFKPDSKIPAETELIDYYGASRITIRRAINDLVEEGLLIKKQGIGTFVKPIKQQRRIVSVASFAEECKKNKIEHGTVLLSRRIVKAKEKDKKMLHVEIGDDLVLIERLRTIEGEPAIIDRDYFTSSYKWLLDVPETELSSLGALLKKHGYKDNKKEANIDYNIEISYAREIEASILNCRVNSPVLLASMCTYDEEMNPLSRSDQIMYGDKFSINISAPFSSEK